MTSPINTFEDINSAMEQNPALRDGVPGRARTQDRVLRKR